METPMIIVDAMPTSADVVSRTAPEPVPYEEWSADTIHYHQWAQTTPAVQHIVSLLNLTENERRWQPWVNPYRDDRPLSWSEQTQQLIRAMGDHAGVVYTEYANVGPSGVPYHRRGYLIGINADGTRAAYIHVLD